MDKNQTSETQVKLPPRTFDLELFKKASEEMIAINDGAYRSSYLKWDRTRPIKDYTPEEIERIISSGDVEAQRRLSRNYAYANGFYKQILTHYATLLRYSGILIPNPAFGKSLQETSIAKRYYNAVDFVELLKLKELGVRIAHAVLRDGIYYGAIQTLTKQVFALLDLPTDFCRSRFQDEYGNILVEFNVRYFATITDVKNRRAALRTYPKVISSHYRKWAKNTGGVSPWVMLPSDIGVAFTLFKDARPYFLDIIPATIKYDESVENEQDRQLEEIKRLVVQEIPHLNDGTLLFEPEEVQVMHQGTVNMLKKSNPNISVLTTYGQVHVEGTTSADTVTNTTLERMAQNIYSQAGVSGELFAATGSSSIPYSLDNDTAFMMVLANKIGSFVTNIVNFLFGNGAIRFKYTMLPITQFNADKFVDSAFKLAGSGYSFLLPAIAQGFTQKDLSNIKDLENDVLKLQDKLKPLSSSYTQSGNEGGEAKESEEDTEAPTEEGGRPPLEPGEETEKTQQNRESKDKTGR